MLAKRLYGFADRTDVLPLTQFGFRKGVGTCDALLYFTHNIQSGLDKGYESRVVALYFSSAFDSVNHAGLLFKLQSLGVGGLFISILEQFLLNRQQRIVVDGFYSSWTPVCSGVPQGSVLGPLFILFTADMWNGILNNLIAYANDSTLYAVVESPEHRVAVTDSLNNISKIEDWCNFFGNDSKPMKVFFYGNKSIQYLPSSSP